MDILDNVNMDEKDKKIKRLKTLCELHIRDIRRLETTNKTNEWAISTLQQLCENNVIYRDRQDERIEDLEKELEKWRKGFYAREEEIKRLSVGIFTLQDELKKLKEKEAVQCTTKN